MSAWTVYWVLQLDEIKTLLYTLAVLSGVCAGLSTFFGGLLVTGYNDEEKIQGKYVLGLARKFGVALVVLFSIGVLTPSSKTAAAMIILPALTSEEVVGTVKSEAKELYEMAKEALKEKITTAEEKKVER